MSGRSNIVTLGDRRFDEFTQDVTEKEVRFLNPARSVAVHDDRKVHRARELAAIAASESHGECTNRCRGINRLEHVRAVARGRQTDRDITRPAQRLNLAGEDHVKGVIVRDRSNQGRVGNERV